MPPLLRFESRFEYQMEPRQFGNYTLLERVSHGGMAEVFRAKSFGEAGFEREVALKLLLPQMASDKEFVDMLIDEAKIAGQLNHANIAQIFDLGAVDGRYFIVQEFVQGQDLRAVLKRKSNTKTKLKVSTACHIAIKVCEGLHYAHNKQDPSGRRLNLVHRDISPHNILISDEGEVKIIDFGIAKADGRSTQTMAGLVKGKFAYMSPEQIRGLPVDHRSDVFATGILLHEMLTSRPLFQAATEFETLKRARAAVVEKPSKYNHEVPPALDAIVLKALARHVDDRYQSAQDLRDALWAFARANNAFAGHEQLTSMRPDDDDAGSSMKLELASEIRVIPEVIEDEPIASRRATTALQPGSESTAPAESFIIDEYTGPASSRLDDYDYDYDYDDGDDNDDDPSENRTVVDPHFAGIAVVGDDDDGEMDTDVGDDVDTGVGGIDSDADWAADVDGPLAGPSYTPTPSFRPDMDESDETDSTEEEETTSNRGVFGNERPTAEFGAATPDGLEEDTAPGPRESDLDRQRRAGTMPAMPNKAAVLASMTPAASGKKKTAPPMALAETEPVPRDLITKKPPSQDLASPAQVGRSSRALSMAATSPVPSIPESQPARQQTVPASEAEIAAAARAPAPVAPPPRQGSGSAPAPMPQPYGAQAAAPRQGSGSAPAPMPQSYGAQAAAPRQGSGSAPAPMPQPYGAQQSPPAQSYGGSQQIPYGAPPQHYGSGAPPMPLISDSGSAPISMSSGSISLPGQTHGAQGAMTPSQGAPAQRRFLFVMGALFLLLLAAAATLTLVITE